MSGMAKFEATVVNFKTTGKKTVVQLELTNTAAARNYMFLVGALDKDVFVQLGDPQMSIQEFGVNAPINKPGFLYQADASGIVERKSDETEQEEQTEFESGMDVADPEQEEGQDEGQQPDEDFELEYGDEQTDSEEEEPVQDEESEGEPEGEQRATEVIGKDELENYILSGNAPTFEGIDYDFPALLKRRRAGESWMTIATSLGISSGKLSTAWSEYRKKVKAYLNGEEHGAA